MTISTIIIDISAILLIMLITTGFWLRQFSWHVGCQADRVHQLQEKWQRYIQDCYYDTGNEHIADLVSLKKELAEQFCLDLDQLFIDADACRVPDLHVRPEVASMHSSSKRPTMRLQPRNQQGCYLTTFSLKSPQKPL